MILEITKAQVDSLAGQNVGISCFMGAVGTDNDLMIDQVKDRYYLTDKEGRKSEQFQRIINEQNQEGKEYCGSLYNHE